MTRSPPLTTALTVLALLFPGAAGAESGWRWPVHGDVITSYSNDNSKPYAGGMHRGIDIAAPVGTQVSASRSGNVSYAGNLGSSGLTVAVRTDDGTYATSYLHLSAIAVSRGQHVDGGQQLGAVGTTGERSAPQPHLHFGVRLAERDNFYVDPLTLLPALPSSVAPAAPAPVSAPVPVRAAEQPVPSATSRARARLPARVPRPLAGRVPEAALRPAPRPAFSTRTGFATRAAKHAAERSGRAAPERGRPLPGPKPVRARHPKLRPLPVAVPEPSGLPWGAIALAGGLALLFGAGIAYASHLGMLDRWRTTRRSRSGSPMRTSRRSMPRLRAAVSRTGRPH